MEVNVDSKLIRSERENRGWTQGQLAQVSGLSLRTIQRIERTGSASLESASSLAAVLSLAIADLRSEPHPQGRKRGLRLSLELPARLALATISGVLSALHFRWGLDSGWADSGFLGALRLHYVVAGTLFAVCVLCPYLRPGKRLALRALALIGASVLSYFCAVTIALGADAWMPVAPVPAAFLLASCVGVGIVLVAARVVIPLRATPAFWWLGLVASLVGGAAMYAAFEVLGDTTATNVAGFCVWQLLVCFAIYRGHESSDSESGLLADFVRAHGRYSIVPGWMNLSWSLPSGFSPAPWQARSRTHRAA